MVEAHPLYWPPSWPRTPENKRMMSKFGQKKQSNESYRQIVRVTFEAATNLLYGELRLLGAKGIILSSNLKLRADGYPYSRQQNIEDPGVAVYFKIGDNEQCVPCDKWLRAEDNIKAIGKTIEALRGIERWGAKEMVDAAFRGFKALPAPGDVIVSHTQYFSQCHNADEAKDLYRKLVKELHPDMGGSADEFNEMTRQYNQLRW